MQNNNLKLKTILLFCILIFCISASKTSAQGASLRLSPQSGTFFVGNTFDVSIIVNTHGNSINAVSADLKFPADKLQVVTPVSGKSFIESWTAIPTYSNTEGTISLKGGIPSPGINTSAGLVSTITFRARAAGTAMVYFLDSSMVLLDDGKGTNILKSFDKGEYTITVVPPDGPGIYSSTHPDQNAWYKDNNPTFSWEKEAGISDFSYKFDSDPKGIPDSVSEGGETIKSFTNVSDGIWYFHLRSKKGDAWGATSHYVAHIDNTPPNSFAPNIESTGKIKRIRPLISFITSDVTSGIDHYEVKITSTIEAGSPYFIEETSPYRVPYLEPGEYTVIVRAYDKADNWTDEMVNIRIVGSKIFSIGKEGIIFRGILYSWWLATLILIVLLGALGFLIYFIWKKFFGLEKFGMNLAKLKEKIQKRRTKLKEEIEKEKNLGEELEKIEQIEEKSDINKNTNE